jgi:hypothetical protein
MDRDTRRTIPYRRTLARAVLCLFAVLVSLAAVGLGSAVGAPEPKHVTLDDYGITIEYHAKDQRVADKVVSIFESVIPRISGELGLTTIRPFRVFLIPDMDSYQEMAALRLPSWGIAFAFMDNQIMLVDVKRAANAWNSLDNVIPHELSHLLLAQRVEEARMPLWFVEGLAQWQAREWSILEHWRLMETVWGNRAPTLTQIAYALPREETRARDAYRVAYVAFQYRFDKRMENIPAFLDEVNDHGDFGEAFNAFWDETELEYSARFADHLSRKYGSGLMLFQTGPLFTLMAVLFLLVVLRTWIRNRRKLARLDDVEGGIHRDDRHRPGRT